MFEKSLQIMTFILLCLVMWLINLNTVCLLDILGFVVIVSKLDPLFVNRLNMNRDYRSTEMGTLRFYIDTHWMDFFLLTLCEGAATLQLLWFSVSHSSVQERVLFFSFFFSESGTRLTLTAHDEAHVTQRFKNSIQPLDREHANEALTWIWRYISLRSALSQMWRF